MLQIFVLRHGKATKYQDDTTDFDRHLNKQGTAQVNQIGFILKENGIIFDTIIHSSAARTFETAEIIRHYIPCNNVISDQELYLTDKKNILQKIISKATGKMILYVGHNNGISDFVTDIIDKPVLLSTSELIELKFETDNWNEISFGTGYKGINLKPNIYSF